MKLEPVYLLAPEPRPPSMTRRRALTGMGLCLFGGAAVGGACGYSLGTAQSDESDGTGELESTGDATLDELRRLAIKAPIEELMSKFVMFSQVRMKSYATDPVLWRGIGRMADHVIEHRDLPQRSLKARVLLQSIVGHDLPSDLDYSEQVQALKRIK